MENKNYYPLRIGNYPSTIVTDVPVERTRQPDEDEVKHYGGWLVAESLPPGLAQQLVDAYNEKHHPKEFTAEQRQEIVSHLEHLVKSYDTDILFKKPYKDNLVQAMNTLTRMLVDSHVVDFVLPKAEPDKPKRLPPTIVMQDTLPTLIAGCEWQMVTKDGYVYREDKKESNDNMHVYKLAKPAKTSISANDEELNLATGLLNRQPPYLADEVGTRSMDDKPSIDQQISFMSSLISDKAQSGKAILNGVKNNLIAIRNWQNSTVYHNVDVQKVIEDLKENLEMCMKVGRTSFDRDEAADKAIQNAEAALGMLQAFKDKRDTPHDVGKHHKYPITEDEAVPSPDVKKDLTVEEVRSLMDKQQPKWVNKYEHVKTESLGKQMYNYAEQQHPGIHDLAQRQSERNKIINGLATTITTDIKSLESELTAKTQARAIVFAVEEILKLHRTNQ